MRAAALPTAAFTALCSRTIAVGCGRHAAGGAARAEAEAARAQAEREALQKERKSLERDLRAEFEESVRDYRENVRAAMRQMKKERTEEAAERARDRINVGAHAVRAALDEAAGEEIPGPRIDWSNLKEGDPVRLMSLSKDAVLVTLPDNKGRLTVEVKGGMRFGVKVEDLGPRVGGAPAPPCRAAAPPTDTAP